MTTVTMTADAFQQFVTQSGTTYNADASGFITGIALPDVPDLIHMGAQVVPHFENASATNQFGGSALGAINGAFYDSGVLYRKAANPIAANGADTTDDILTGITLPAGALDIAGRGIEVTVRGLLGATANDKAIKIWANPVMAGQTVSNGVISGGTVTSGTLLADSGTLVDNAKGWEMILELRKYGAAASNTQYAQSKLLVDAVPAISVPAFTTLTESAAINIVVTGSSLTTGAANDVKLASIKVLASN